MTFRYSSFWLTLYVTSTLLYLDIQNFTEPNYLDYVISVYPPPSPPPFPSTPPPSPPPPPPPPPPSPLPFPPPPPPSNGYSPMSPLQHPAPAIYSHPMIYHDCVGIWQCLINLALFCCLGGKIYSSSSEICRTLVYLCIFLSAVYITFIQHLINSLIL